MFSLNCSRFEKRADHHLLEMIKRWRLHAWIFRLIIPSSYRQLRLQPRILLGLRNFFLRVNAALYYQSMESKMPRLGQWHIPGTQASAYYYD